MVGMTGGGKLEAYLSKIAEKVAVRQEVQVGFQASAVYPDGTSVALVAAIQEWGAPSRGIPPRPFFRTMIAEHKDEWGDQLGKALVATDYDATRALELMGDKIAGQLVDSIDATNSPPLAASTVARKGFEKPLVDSGDMRNSVKSVVTEGR